MRTYTVSEFRENLASALDRAADEVVIIKRNDKEYEVKLRKPAQERTRSPLDVPRVKTRVPATLDSILDDVEKARARR